MPFRQPILKKEVKPRGFHYPFSKRADGFPSADNPPDIYTSNIKQILLTVFGERVMRPNFGSGLKALLFESMPNNLIYDLAKNVTRQAIETWEPRVRILNIDATSNESTLTIRVDYISGAGTGEVGILLKKDIT